MFFNRKFKYKQNYNRNYYSTIVDCSTVQQMHKNSA